MDILSKEGSIKFKNLIATAKNTIPNSRNVAALNNLSQALILKKNQATDRLALPNISQGERNTIKTYLDDINEVINSLDERINVLNNSEVGGSKRRKSRRKSTRKSRRNLRRKSRRK